MIFEIRQGHESELDEILQAEAPIWGNGNLEEYKKLWADHISGGEYWVMTRTGITPGTSPVVASLAVFQPPHFNLPEGSTGIGTLLVRPFARGHGYGAFLLRHMLYALGCGPERPCFGFSDIAPDMYFRMGARPVPPIVDRSKVCPRCRQPEAQLIVWPKEYSVPVTFQPPTYF